MSHLSRWCSFAVVVALAGCASTTSPQLASTSMVGAASLASNSFDVSKTPPTSALRISDGGKAKIDLTRPESTNVEDTDYRISPLDMLQISVFQVPELSKTVRVAADGRISLNLIGEVTAAGKSAHQLETEIATALGSKYLQSPEVSVFVSDAVSQRVTVEGAVNKPGIYPAAGGTTLMQVIALSGGLNEIADNKAVVVFRTVGKTRQAAVFDYTAVRKGTVTDPVIQGGDIVAVDQSGMKATMRNLRETIGVFNLFAPLAPLI